MSLQDAYRRVDHALAQRPSPPSYVLIPEARAGALVVDFVLPLETADRDAIVTIIVAALGDQRGRDRLMNAQKQTSSVPAGEDRRTAA